MNLETESETLEINKFVNIESDDPSPSFVQLKNHYSGRDLGTTAVSNHIWGLRTAGIMARTGSKKYGRRIVTIQ